MPSPTLRPVAEMPSPTDWMAPPTAVPAPATVVSTAVQKGSRSPIVFVFWWVVGWWVGLGGGDVVRMWWCFLL